MPKMKTHRSAQKRYKITGTGKLTRGKCGRSHLNVTFSSSRKRRLDSNVVVDPGAEKNWPCNSLTASIAARSL